jgi:hypothetical protein
LRGKPANQHEPAQHQLFSEDPVKTLFFAFALATFAVPAVSQQAANVPSKVAAMKVLEGRVERFLEPGLFWLSTADGSKTLIYSDGEATKRLRSGQKVRITGTEPTDWARLAESELSAKKIELVKL